MGPLLPSCCVVTACYSLCHLPIKKARKHSCTSQTSFKENGMPQEEADTEQEVLEPACSQDPRLGPQSPALPAAPLGPTLPTCETGTTLALLPGR